MKRLLLFGVSLLGMTVWISSCAVPPNPSSGLPEPKTVLAVMERAADWSLAHPDPRRGKANWENATLYIGVLELSKISSDDRYLQAIKQIAEENQWQPGREYFEHVNIYFADNHCVIQSYLELYKHYRERRMIEPSQQEFDAILAKPAEQDLRWVSEKHWTDPTRRWSWCDALFMAPMSWLMMWEATGDERYLDFMNQEWWATTDYLFSEEYGLYFRDSRFFDRKEENGKPVFWSRGNGWVAAGLTRVLDLFPEDHPDYRRYRDLYLRMMRSIRQAQRPDGFWSSSLLAPESYPQEETSGSSFMVCALAWGINRGLLPRDEYLPTVVRGWNAVVSCVDEDGKLTSVQPIGDTPRHFDPDHNEPFGTGAFLLAGAQVYRLAGGAPKP